jgi:arabinan endo-1,5-alpha-L-arabinosidase
MKRFVKISLVMLVTVAFLASGIAGAASIDAKRLLLYWSCDEGKGDTLKDSSGRGFDGKLNGSYDWVKGQVNGAVELKGGYGEAKGNVIGSTSQTGEITLACWFKLIDHSAYSGTVSIASPLCAASCCYRYLLNAAFNPFWNAGQHVDRTLANVIFDKNKWYHTALTADGKSGKIYVDGKLAGEVVENFKLPDLPDVTVFIGRGETNAIHPLEDGIIDEVSIWDKALSEAELQAIMKPNFMAVTPNGRLSTTWADLKTR